MSHSLPLVGSQELHQEKTYKDVFMDVESSSDDFSPPPHPSSLLFYIIHHQPSLTIDRIRRDLRGSQHGRVGDYNGPWHADGREQPDGEEVLPCGNISSTSLSDLMDKIRHRAARGSISRDASITSNLSEMVSMPHGSRRLFKREDSVCSNLSGVSDLAPSECSEMSLDVSVQEDLASLTFTCFNNIEHELDDLKSSMLEMDEEVTKFVARPDPYSFKTTFSDYSMGSGESRPSSAMEILSAHRSRANLRLNLQPARPNTSSDSEVVEGGTADASLGSNHLVSGSEAEGSLEWDSPQHGWTSAKAPVLSKLQELPSEDAESSHASMQVNSSDHNLISVCCPISPIPLKDHLKQRCLWHFSSASGEGYLRR
ncbi:hypothetical protein E2C01_041519 [Portunus trituberculatus]|uniref:Uncharacterized protein n=1 Tax=Portunus trituberculatus TaxID=210409 RepID=A0A5B7FK71_PORTR|nr:hypothetical protein [Portunus trituberculatus]